MRPIKKAIYALTFPLLVLSGLAFANREVKNEAKPSPKPSSVVDRTGLDNRKTWEASADGIKFKNWEASAEGKKVAASHDKIRKHLEAFSNMEALVTSTTFRRTGNSSGIKWLIVRIKDEDYMMQFNPQDFQNLTSLKVKDQITIRSRSAGRSPNHPYLVLSGDHIERNGKVLFKRDFSKNRGC